MVLLFTTDPLRFDPSTNSRTKTNAYPISDFIIRFPRLRVNHHSPVQAAIVERDARHYQKEQR